MFESAQKVRQVRLVITVHRVTVIIVQTLKNCTQKIQNCHEAKYFIMSNLMENQKKLITEL
jgi:phosphosulfolactate phosphohydrolase-like enzyme